MIKGSLTNYKLFILIILVLGLCLSYGSRSIAAAAFSYDIVGLSDPLLSQVRSQLATQNDKQASTTIRKVLQAYGYFKPKIRSKVTQRNMQPHVVYYIDPGPVLRITDIDLIIVGPGANDPDVKALIAHFPLQRGQPLETLTYNQAKQLLFTTVEQKGYIAAELNTHVIKIDLKRYTAQVTLHFNTGPRFFFGAIKFSSTPFTEEFLRRYLPFQAGQPYATSQLLTLQDNLTNSNYFQYVSAEPIQAQTRNQRVPIQVALTPRKSQQYSVGLGYGTDTGPRLGLGFDWRYVNSEGHRFSTLLQVSPVRNSLQALYTIPGAHPTTDWYTLNAGLLQDHLPQSDSLTKQIGVAKVRGVGNWQHTYSLNYQIEDFQFVGQPWQHSNLLIPGVNWVYKQADDVIYTMHGDQLSINLQGTTEQLFSATTFLQAEVQAKSIRSPTNVSRVILRGDVGYTVAQDLNSLPASLRFYAGGSQSIRGYDFQQLGPGRYLAVGSAEYQHQIVGNWNAAVFYDVGNAFDNFPATLQHSVGVGIVWRSPIGPMELTLARPLERPPGRSFMVQFIMGPDLG